MTISMEDAAILAAQSTETLCLWECLLNCWEWPEEIPNPEPPYTGSIYLPEKYARRAAIRKAIEEVVGEKELSRYWNTKYRTDGDKPTEEEWLAWWRENYETPEQAE
jgi:hypothetical protein